MKMLRIDEHVLAIAIKGILADAIDYACKYEQADRAQQLLPTEICEAIWSKGYGFADEYYDEDYDNWLDSGYAMPSTKCVISGIRKFSGGNHRPILKLTDRQYKILVYKLAGVENISGTPKKRVRQIDKWWHVREGIWRYRF